MEEKIKALEARLKEELGKVADKEQLSLFWQQFLGKNGEIQGLMKEMKNVPKEERPSMGQLINRFKSTAEENYKTLEQKLEQVELERKNKAESVDITLPAKVPGVGGLHPITLVKNQLVDIFAGMGFFIYEGPEIEDDDHNFTRLNVLKDHPARDMQDTFYVSENQEFLLRTHTSPGQVRIMDCQQPPIKVLVPGRVFRSDSDATHSPMFHQMEGLVVDKHVTLSDLQGLLDKLAKEMFSEVAKTRLRPSYFPFTEPSVEVDISCFECGGKGCGLCKGTGWIEVLGGGVVNRKVLANCGIDPDEYSGLAFGIGIERIAMLKYGINNMGLLFENDIRFLDEFKG